MCREDFSTKYLGPGDPWALKGAAGWPLRACYANRKQSLQLQGKLNPILSKGLEDLNLDVAT